MAKRQWLGPPREKWVPAVPNGSWSQRHPTRYMWNDDVRDMVDELFLNFKNISINTYVDHPDGWSARLGYNTAVRSLDVWGPYGRGDPIDPARGSRIVNYIMNDPDERRWVSWLIWQGNIWSRSAGSIWIPFDDDGTGLHFDHPHVTYMPRGWRP